MDGSSRVTCVQLQLAKELTSQLAGWLTRLKKNNSKLTQLTANHAVCLSVFIYSQWGKGKIFMFGH